MRRWLWVAGVAAALGCGGDGSPGPTSTRRSCTQLGWVCGIDDYGSSCGSCSGGRVCNFGTCISAGCTPACGARTCGVELVCGSSCGSCLAGQTCSASGTCTTPTVTPTSHTLASAMAPLFSNFYGVQFTVPAAAVAYAASSPGDTFNVGIFTPVDWAIYSNRGSGAQAYAGRQNVRSANEGASLPAGTYYLGFYCTNLIERCAVTYAITAVY